MLKEGIFLGKRYEILERIGSGGMADVYKGKDHKLNRFVAVKVLKSDYRSDEVFIQKFLSEAQAAAGLMHPNVVNVYDVGQDRGLYYMVMELVEGITLKQYIQKKGRLSAKEAISITIHGDRNSGGAQSAYHSQGYQAAEYHHFQRRKSKGDGFRDRAGDDFDEHDQHQRDGIGALHFAGAGAGRNCGREERHILRGHHDV